MAHTSSSYLPVTFVLAEPATYHPAGASIQFSSEEVRFLSAYVPGGQGYSVANRVPSGQKYLMFFAHANGFNNLLVELKLLESGRRLSVVACVSGKRWKPCIQFPFDKENMSHRRLLGKLHTSNTSGEF